MFELEPTVGVSACLNTPSDQGAIRILFSTYKLLRASAIENILSRKIEYSSFIQKEIFSFALHRRAARGRRAVASPLPARFHRGKLDDSTVATHVLDDLMIFCCSCSLNKIYSIYLGWWFSVLPVFPFFHVYHFWLPLASEFYRIFFGTSLSLSLSLTAVLLLFFSNIGYGFMSAEETLGSLFRGGAGFSFSLAFKDFATKYLLLHYYWVQKLLYQPLPIATSLICFLSSNSEHHACAV